jgi:hypothetical protein
MTNIVHIGKIRNTYKMLGGKHGRRLLCDLTVDDYILLILTLPSDRVQRYVFVDPGILLLILHKKGISKPNA